MPPSRVTMAGRDREIDDSAERVDLALNAPPRARSMTEAPHVENVSCHDDVGSRKNAMLSPSVRRRQVQHLIPSPLRNMYFRGPLKVSVGHTAGDTASSVRRRAHAGQHLLRRQNGRGAPLVMPSPSALFTMKSVRPAFAIFHCLRPDPDPSSYRSRSDRLRGVDLMAASTASVFAAGPVSTTMTPSSPTWTAMFPPDRRACRNSAAAAALPVRRRAAL